MTLEDALKTGRNFLLEKGIEDGNIDAWYLLSYYFNVTRADYLLHPSMSITREQYDSYFNLIQMRSNHIPLQHITSEQEFMGLSFYRKQSA
jgi:release factor glutamine methyltransferase